MNCSRRLLNLTVCFIGVVEVKMCFERGGESASNHLIALSFIQSVLWRLLSQFDQKVKTCAYTEYKLYKECFVWGLVKLPLFP